MRFESAELIKALTLQVMREHPYFDGVPAQPVVIYNRAGSACGEVSAREALALVFRGSMDAFIGVGNRQRIRHLKPAAEHAMPWAGGSRTTRPVKADETCRHFAPGQAMGSTRHLREHNPIIR